MPWNWELPNWPHFIYDSKHIIQKERQFLLNAGHSSALSKIIGKKEFAQFAIEILIMESLQSAKIEGESLDRESLQSSIEKHFELKTREPGQANLPLTHEMLWDWNKGLFGDLGKYRTHVEPMQIISHRFDSRKVFFEAPPSAKIFDEMTTFIQWFNSTSVSEPILGRAALAHIYFESIHPFEDGNGRIGRVLVEKVLSQGVKQPILIAVSKVLEKRKKEYYAQLERCNMKLEVDHWVEFFAEVILQAQEESLKLLNFLIAKLRLMTELSGKINPRQERVLMRLFEEGPSGFKGGLSAENYLAITKTSRATATRDLADLVEKGALVKTGELRHTRYWLQT